jgi:hypothetical protein
MTTEENQAAKPGMSVEEFQAEHARLQHAVQSGIAIELERGSQCATPKHLRVGLCTALADHGSLCRLLVSKGLITEQELHEALIEGMTDEVKLAEARLSAEFGITITLG